MGVLSLETQTYLVFLLANNTFVPFARNADVAPIKIIGAVLVRLAVDMPLFPVMLLFQVPKWQSTLTGNILLFMTIHSYEYVLWSGLVWSDCIFLSHPHFLVITHAQCLLPRPPHLQPLIFLGS